MQETPAGNNQVADSQNGVANVDEQQNNASQNE